MLLTEFKMVRSFIIMILTFASVDEILWCYHPNGGKSVTYCKTGAWLYLCHQFPDCLLCTSLLIRQYFISFSQFIELFYFLHNLCMLSCSLCVHFRLCPLLCYVLLQLFYLTFQVFTSLLKTDAFRLGQFTFCLRNLLFTANKPVMKTKELSRGAV